MEKQLPTYVELEQAWENCLGFEEKPPAFVASTAWLHLAGVMVEGPGPWLVTKDKITQIELED